MPNDTYKYDLARLSAAKKVAQEAAAVQESEEPAQSPPRRPPSYGRIISRFTRGEKLPSVSEPEIDSEHKIFCPVCRGVMLGSGYPVKVLARDDGKQVDEVYYHLPRKILKSSASIGCPLCRFILEELRQRLPDSEIEDEEKAAFGYDFGNFLSSGGERDKPLTLALLFFEWVNGGVTNLVFTLHDLTGREPTTAAALVAARIWIAQCQRGHSCVQGPTATPKDADFLPKRLVDVGENDESIRLVASGDIQDPDKISYMSLSHCWGDPAAHKPYYLTTARLDEYAREIPASKLPKTFLDACGVTRALSQKYIWIDSLCIIQDSKQDWAEQSAEMWQVYRNSYLNISATASRSPEDGLFRERPKNGLLPCIIHVGKQHPEFPEGNYRLYSESQWTRNVDDAPINSRAWVLQERLLAPRILHFTAREVYWECHCLKASESFPLGMLPRVECKSRVSIDGDTGGAASGDVQHYALLKTWNSIVERYSPLNLAFPSDKLVALSALARQVSLAFPAAGKYLAGLWEAPLIAQLLWQSSTPKTASRPGEYRAPSWSWACIDGQVDPNFDFAGYELFGDKSVSRPMLKVLSVSTTVDTSQLYGAVRSGQLKVAGCLLTGRLHERRKRPERAPKTAQEHLAEWKEFMGTVIPGYTGENLQVITNSLPETTNDTHMGVDVANGVIISDESSHWWEGHAYDPKLWVGENCTLDITLDVEGEMTALAGLDLFVLPVSCVSANNRRYNRESNSIHSLGCLILRHQEGSPGTYRRVGVCGINDDSVPAILCELGNQEEQEIPNQGLSPEVLDLEHFVPATWAYKELDFVPKQFKLVEITIV
ncbi:hypothetical protein MFIFM68171_02853 [Madurella fahalii]|uniref:Heterokaryon incompatibility domain-containing protein n=1 Tax=Madurella fahalii TaxID=1157608 RepID=A0ABQ0G4G9_9PEZI